MSNRHADSVKWSDWLPKASTVELTTEIRDLRGLLADGTIRTADGVWLTDLMLAALKLELARRRTLRRLNKPRASA